LFRVISWIICLLAEKAAQENKKLSDCFAALCRFAE
jgi:hypothetical protein